MIGGGEEEEGGRREGGGEVVVASAADPRQYQVLDVVRNLVAEDLPPSPSPPPPPPPHDDLSDLLGHADEDDPIRASLQARTKEPLHAAARATSVADPSGFYNDPGTDAFSASSPSVAAVPPPLLSSAATGRYSSTDSLSLPFSLPSRVEPGLAEMAGAFTAGWENFTRAAGRKIEEVKARVGGEEGGRGGGRPEGGGGLEEGRGDHPPAAAAASRFSLFSSSSSSSSSNPPLVQSDVTLPPPRSPFSVVCGAFCGVTKAFCRQDTRVKQAIVMSLFACWVVWKMRM